MSTVTDPVDEIRAFVVGLREQATWPGADAGAQSRGERRASPHGRNRIKGEGGHPMEATGIALSDVELIVRAVSAARYGHNIEIRASAEMSGRRCRFTLRARDTAGPRSRGSAGHKEVPLWTPTGR